MSLMKIDFGNEAEFTDKLKIIKCAAIQTPSTWKSSHFGLLIKTRLKSENLSKNDVDSEDLPMDKEEVDKIFRDKEKECGHMKNRKVKPLQFDLIISYMRANRSSMSVDSLHRIITEFCKDSSYDFRIQRSEAWTFIMEHLEERPPLDLKSRMLWMDLLSFGRCKTNRCDHLVKAFSESCLAKLLQYEDVSYEYKLFIMDLLELDFASVLNYHDSVPVKIPVKQKKTGLGYARKVRIKIELNDLSNLESIPLAYLLISMIKKGDLVESDLDQEHLYEKLGRLFDESTDLMHKKLYARLIGLLFDVHLFVSQKDLYFRVFDHESLPAVYRNHMRKVRMQISDDKEDLITYEKLHLFSGIVGVKWCADLILSIHES